MENQALNIRRTSSRIAGSRRARPSGESAFARCRIARLRARDAADARPGPARFRCGLIALALLLLSSPAAAQALRARLLAAASDTPIPGAFLTLRPAGGGDEVARLSDAHGRAVLPVPRAGRYRLRVEQLGYGTVELDIVLGDSVESRTFRLGVAPIALPAITATGARKCEGASAPAAEAALIWEEVRKALEVARWTAAEKSLRYVIRESRQRLDPRTLAVLDEQITHAEVEQSGSPFVSRGAADLSEKGFIRTASDAGYEYYGPDAEVILSPAFQERHCFQAVSDPRSPERVGLRFTPARNAPRFDIEGVLWLDRATAELRFLEYRYNRLPVRAPGDHAAGRIDFERLASGHWIVQSWWIRAPRTAPTGPGSAPRMIGVDRVGREVLSVTERER